ncbi:hypothetical protein ASPWEDRAFT_36671 [Aspergillus wentii DTO 134E9]|uniref:Ribosomal RNA processing protein n=1 Tax=Aspergillus wentii DTO 134E9 TaxID=1073089 RepID=A0A1L9RVL7_ASPWE|nr:uncharacterized protein ASPWEDRAFT_36671 [Aspergillus wentii DTO 134E9]KAI9928861.1 ribosomal RNA-processing protein 1 [Aspergillus wentii]OJJ38965.1 hypothetical protein ASPWEDRAFT_36671 [Aspergillus wentii DTO 134E9]
MAEMQNTPFMRELVSSDRKTRDKALDSLTLYIRSKTDLTLLDLLKLWKGLFFCFYHSDRPLTQQALARALSYSLVPTLPRQTLHRFLRAFWITIGRDFHSLDRLRLDKYLFLIRCYVGVAFEIFVKGKKTNASTNGSNKKRKREEAAQKEKGKKRSKGKKEEARPEPQEDEEEDDDNSEDKWADLSAYLSIIEEGPLCPLNFDPDQPTEAAPGDTAGDTTPMPHGPDGLRYHILDLWIDEVEKVLEFEEGTEDSENRKVKGDVPMDLLLRPLEKLRTESPYKPVRVRAAEALDDDRLVEWGFKTREVEEEEEDDESDQEWGGFDD